MYVCLNFTKQFYFSIKMIHPKPFSSTQTYDLRHRSKITYTTQYQRKKVPFME